ncbi:MAG: VWA domain-containing protein [Pseudomonadales bacterium]|nr:VWA domain-containing protein [Pseudomonadales bacterium]
MLINFFFRLRDAKIPVTIRELMDLLEALKHHLAIYDMDAFYQLSRTCLVKDERHYDKFDRTFAEYFEGVKRVDPGLLNADIPDEWLKKAVERHFSQEEMDAIKELGGLDKLMEEFQKRLEEQKERHQGGNKWIGTAGTSPFGAYGTNPAGFRTTGESRNKRAVKVWEKRQYKNLDDSRDLGIRNIKMALRRLRRLARSGAAEELNVHETIQATAEKGGLLDIKMMPERRNRVKVLLFFDVGGSMDPHVRVCEELFSAARSEFKNMEFFYFHNFIYEGIWTDNHRRWEDSTPTWDIIHKYPQDYRVIFIGDASMAPMEVSSPGGSVEHYNDESGAAWMHRIQDHFDKVVWLNPEPEASWRNVASITHIQALMERHMYPLTIKGIEESMRYLSR